jgi:hemolysin III
MEGKPRMRGVLHAIAAPVALAGGITLVVIAGSPGARIASALFALTSVVLFATSATYHLGHWVPRTTARLRRLDHANIFLLIAGTYTPLSLLLLPAAQARVLLAVVWTGAIAGVLIRNLWLTAPRWAYVPIYVLLGWAALFYLPGFAGAGAWILGLIVAGGLLYTLGAAVYATKWPRLNPRWFGFHEVFHSFTIAAFIAHFAAVALTLARFA